MPQTDNKSPYNLEPRQIGKINGRGLWTLYTKEVQRFMSVWLQTIMAPVVTTLLFLAIFYLALGGAVREINGMPFILFLAPGLLAMAVAQNQMMAEVPKADVVIVNPTHYAVALRYKPTEGDVAPTVVAKGADFLALRIREMAAEHKIPLYEDPPLARQLYAEVDIDDDGTIRIYGSDAASRDAAVAKVEEITAEAEVGQVYEGTVARIVDFGAFVNILPGKDGLVHISQISQERVEKVTDYLSEGQVVKVKVLDVDQRGRIKLSMKELEEAAAEPAAEESPEAE